MKERDAFRKAFIDAKYQPRPLYRQLEWWAPILLALGAAVVLLILGYTVGGW